MATVKSKVHDHLTNIELSRRQLLGASAGAAGGAALSGAGALPGLSGRAVRAQDGGAEFHAAWPYQAPPNGHFNHFVASAIMGPGANIYGDLIVQPLGLYYWSLDEWLPIMATEWSFLEDGVTFQVRLREGAVWEDGTEFNAEDVLATMWCLRIMSNTVWQYIESVEALDDYTVNFTMSEPSTVVERYVIRMNVRSRSTFGEWAARAEDLFTSGLTIDDPDGAQLLDEFTQFRPETLISNGPFTIDVSSITNAQLTMVKNDTAWNADDVAFDRIITFNGETDTISAVVLSGNVDYATHAFAPATEQEMIDLGIRILRPPLYTGPAILINYGRWGEAFNDPRTRQALAHAVDRAQNAQIARGESGVAVQYMTGMSDTHVSTWVEEGAIEQFNQYPYDQELAATLLEEAGWSRDGETWLLPNGEPAVFELSFPAEFADWSASGQDLAEQLTNFGIEVIPLAVSFTQHPIDVDQGNFDLAIRGWGSSSNPHPHFSYDTAFFVNNTLAVNQGGEGISYPLVQDTEVAGEVDLEQLTIEAAQGLDEAAQRANITTIALVFNELLPKIPLYESFGNNPVLEGERVEAWPPDDDPLLQNSPYADGIVTMAMLTGAIQPAE